MFMQHFEKNPTGIVFPTNKLRQLILDNPDLPIMVLAGDEANTGDYSYMTCSSVSAEVGEYLDCQQIVDDEHCYTDRDEFEEDLSDRLSDDFEGTDEEFDKAVKDALAEYEPYWKNCIIVYVNN